MELIYSMRRNPLKCEPPQYENISDPDVIRPICTISSCNIIAFSSPTELKDCDGDTWGGHVYVCDLDTPWDSHKVTTTVHPVSTLEWDGDGSQLLVATTEGEVSVFGQKDFLLNEWTLLYTATFPGEHIIKAVFFHSGRRVVCVDKKPDAPVTERIQALRSTPTLKGFGGAACPGAVVVSATGLVCLVAPRGAGARALTAAEPLRARRAHVTRAAIAHKNGNLLIAAVQSSSRPCVRCALCGVTRAPPAPAPAPAPPRAAAALTLQPLPTVYLLDPTPPSCITWCLREDSDSLLIAGASLTLWKLVERSHPIHKLLMKGPTPGGTTPGGGQKPPTDCFNTVAWQQTGKWPIEGAGGAHVASARVPLAGARAVLATARALHLLSRDATHFTCSRPVVSHGPAPAPPDGTPPKKPKYGTHALPAGSPRATVSCADISWLGGVAVAVDSLAQLHVYRHTVHTGALGVQQVCSLLEYALVAGIDYLDVLLTLRPNLAEAVYDRVSEWFPRQPAAFQQYHYHGWLKMRAALCRVIPAPWAASSVSWLASQQACLGAWAGAQAALRADERDALHALLREPAPAAPPADLDKALLALEARTEPCAESGALHALRRPLQRVLHIALTALACHSLRQPHGYDLTADPAAVTLIRKLLAVSRGVTSVASVGGGGEPAVGRLLARLHATPTPKPDLIEECVSAASAAGVRVWDAPPRCAVSAAPRALPLYFEYGVEPEALRVVPEPPAAFAQYEIVPSPTMDSIRYMYLGGAPARWRQCARCGSRAAAHAQPARHPLQRAYDARFLPRCRCGGKWTLVSNI